MGSRPRWGCGHSGVAGVVGSLPRWGRFHGEVGTAVRSHLAHGGDRSRVVVGLCWGHCGVAVGWP